MRYAKTAVVVLFLLVSSKICAEIYLWPLHGERRLSSTFGEYREGHFHAGVDLRTFGRVGLPCLAVGDGTVRRIKVAPAGYGKALYLGLDDGRTAVYAHLDGFSRSLDSLVYYRRLEGNGSWCDLNLPEGAFRFAVGETLAFTGTTGSSAPHLHFEMRDSHGRPFNPLEELYAVPDDEPPVISGLEVVPLEAGSLVDGYPSPRISLFRASGWRLYVMDDTLQLDGVFGFGVCLWDEQGYGRYRMAPIVTEISIDDRLLFRRTNRVFDYSQTREIVLEYDQVAPGVTGRYILFFRKPEGTLGGRTGPGFIHSTEDSEDGMYCEPGIHRGEIVSTDTSGNTSRAVFHFALHSYPVVEVMKKLSAASEVVVSGYDPDGGPVREVVHESIDGGLHWRKIDLERFGRYLKGDTSPIESAVYRYAITDDEGCSVTNCFASPKAVAGSENVFCTVLPTAVSDGITLSMQTDRILAAEPTVVRLAHGSNESLRVVTVGEREFAAAIDAGSLTGGINIVHVSGTGHRGYPLHAAKAVRIVRLASGERARFVVADTLQIELLNRSRVEPIVCLVNEVASPGAPPPGLRVVSPAFVMDIPADRLLRPLRLFCDPGVKVGLFRWKEGKGWKCVGVPAMEGGELTVDTGGMYAFFEDGLPPHIRHVAVEEQPSGSGFFKPFVLSVPVEETGCGIDPYSAEVVLNGRRAVCEWDDFRERLYVPVPASVAGGSATLKIEISDRAGNRSVGEFGFVIE